MIGPGKKEIDVVIQDSTSPLFRYFLMREDKIDITLTAPVSIGNEVINVSAGHGFIADAGEYITLFKGNVFTQAKVKSVAANAITIVAPIASAYTVAGTTVVRGNIHMNVDGSGGDVEFRANLRDVAIPIDISKIVITMQHGANVPDDGKFGGLTALTNGVYFRKENASIFSLGNYTMNQDFKDTGGTVEYTTKAPAGTNATNIVFDIKATFGQVIRIHPSLGDIIKGIIRDDIDATEGMAKMTASLIGSYTEGEA